MKAPKKPTTKEFGRITIAVLIDEEVYHQLTDDQLEPMAEAVTELTEILAEVGRNWLAERHPALSLREVL